MPRDRRTKAQQTIDFQNAGARGPTSNTPMDRETIAARAASSSCGHCGGSMRCDDPGQVTPCCSRCGREETADSLIAGAQLHITQPGLDKLVRHVMKTTVARVADTYVISPQRVAIHYDTFSDEDGGDSFSIVLTLRPSDGRQKHDNVLSGHGDDLAAAEADLARKWKAHLTIEAEDAAKRKKKRQ